ncbi:MAG: PaaI family thioesterase [Bacillota bacterium]|nr:MAG: PaaI family thioesterase [Bacillota bacterium]
MDRGEREGWSPATGGTRGEGRQGDDEIPFRRLLGIRVISAGAGRATLVMPWQPGLGNRFATVHGGALATLADAAMSNAILSALAPGDRIGGTMELSIRFLRPAEGDVRAEGRVLYAGGRVAFAQADLHDAAGRLVATAQGTFALQRQARMEPGGTATTESGQARGPGSGDSTRNPLGRDEGMSP